MAFLQKLSSTDLNYGNSIRSLLEQLIIQVDTQQNKFIGLRDEHDRLLTDNYELEKRITNLERYSSYMNLNFHGTSDGGEYPVHSIVRILRSVQIFIEPQDIATCHYLPGKKIKIDQLFQSFCINIKKMRFGTKDLIYGTSRWGVKLVLMKRQGYFQLF